MNSEQNREYQCYVVIYKSALVPPISEQKMTNFIRVWYLNKIVIVPFLS